MKYSTSISLECPYCNTKSQFVQYQQQNNTRPCCSVDTLIHIPYTCTHCKGLITTQWREDTGRLVACHPKTGGWKPTVNLTLITNKSVRDDFQEAINCFNNGFHNACMIMARRAIQQEMIIKEKEKKTEKKAEKSDNLYKQIESTEISGKLKQLLHKVKIFGNNGAHPDFCLFDSNGEQTEDKKKIAKLSLEFLSRYFADEYEITAMINNAPKSKQELKKE